MKLKYILLMILLCFPTVALAGPCDYCYTEEEHQRVLFVLREYEKLQVRLSVFQDEYDEFIKQSQASFDEFKLRDTELTHIKNGKLISVVEENPKLKLVDGKFEGTDQVLIHQFISDPEGGRNLLDYMTTVDLNTKIDYVPVESTWWERNSFKVGVIGGVAVTVGVLALAGLVGGGL